MWVGLSPGAGQGPNPPPPSPRPLSNSLLSTLFQHRPNGRGWSSPSNVPLDPVATDSAAMASYAPPPPSPALGGRPPAAPAVRHGGRCGRCNGTGVVPHCCGVLTAACPECPLPVDPRPESRNNWNDLIDGGDGVPQEMDYDLWFRM